MTQRINGSMTQSHTRGLSDLASSAYYVGGDAENVIGKSAPRFILAVMLFSYAVRALYIESSSMFVRGCVYRVVKEAMGFTLAKLSISALLFDYVLTGPISGVFSWRAVPSARPRPPNVNDSRSSRERGAGMYRTSGERRP
jgi:hypothetical protein